MIGILSDYVNVCPIVDSAVGSIASITSILSATKEITKAFKSKLTLLSEFIKNYYKLLKLCISLQFKEPKMYFADSQYIRCIFGYYRSKYLRRAFHQAFRVVEFDFSVHNNFFTVNGGGI